MQKKPTKKPKANSKNKSKSKTKKSKAFHNSDCSLLEDGANVASISDLFKNEALKKKHLNNTSLNHNNPNSNHINFNSTVNNYTSVYTVISSIHPTSSKIQKPKISAKNVQKQTSSNPLKKKNPSASQSSNIKRHKSKSKIYPAQNAQKQAKQTRKKNTQANPSHTQKLQSYELIPQSKNSFNSEIIFSTQQTKRDSSSCYNDDQKRRRQSQLQEDQRESKSSRMCNDSFLKVNQENLVLNNKLLRSTIKQQFRIKSQAATKIQKVFRGYLTRRILQKYIRQQQQKLQGLLQNYKSSSNPRENRFQAQPNKCNPLRNNYVQKSPNHSQYNPHQKQFFSNRSHDSSQQSSKIVASSKYGSPKTFQDQESINLSKINPSNYFRMEDSKVSEDRVYEIRRGRHGQERGDDEEGSQQRGIVNCQGEVVSSDQEEDSQSESGDCRDGSEENDDEVQERSDEEFKGRSENSDYHQPQSHLFQQQESESNSSEQIIAYRHQEPIYNGSQIEQFLQSSSSSENDSQQQFVQKFPKTFVQNQVIFETNEEHIQSRKNSLLNKQKQIEKKKSLTLAKEFESSDNCFARNKGLDTQKEKYQEKEQAIDQDLIKTSKVNSIHNHSQSQKASIKSSQSVSPKTKKQLLQSQSIFIEQPSQKTSKKQCKIVQPTKKALNIKISSQNSQISASEQGSHTDPILSHTQQMAQHIDRINLQATEKYSPPNLTSKQVFMDTISYNSQFKAKHQILTPTQKISEKNSKQLMKKKKIYYFSDESDQVLENEKQEENRSIKNLRTPNRSPRQRDLQSSNQLQKLKSSQMQRWDEVIRLMNSQLKDMTQPSGKSKELEGFIKQVMQLSLKNKEILKQMMSQQNSESKSHSNTFKNSRIDEMLEQKDYASQDSEKEKKWKQFKDTLSSGRRKSITEQDIAVFKPNSRVILSNKQGEKQPITNIETNLLKSKPSFFKQPKEELKQKINKLQQENFNIEDSHTKEFTLMNFQNDQIQQMLKIREEMLEKRECEELTELNEKLIKKQINQKQFLQKLKQLTDNFNLEKVSIDKAREDIAKGYNAAVKLIREAFSDAKKIGYKLPMSKSSDSYKLQKHLGFGVLSGLNNVIIDELNSKDHFFTMKHVNEHSTLGSKDNQYSKKQSQTVIVTQTHPLLISEQHPTSNKDNLQTPSRSPQPKQFTRSHPVETLSLANVSNNFSQSSGSIINNLTESQTSFKHHEILPQTSPKHQSVNQTPDSSMKSSIFAGNESHDFDDMSEESSDIEFSEEELRRFRKAQPYDPSIADMNRNVMIGKEFFQMQKFSNDPESNTDNDKTSNDEEEGHLKTRLYREVYEIEENEADSVMGHQLYTSKSTDPKTDLIAQKQLQFLIFEVASQLLMKPLFSEKFLQLKRQQMFGIKKVSDQCRKQFIEQVENLMPGKQELFAKINQNISPLPKQLLKCMRIDFSEEDEEENEEEYEQIGKYEMILDQDLCNLAIDKYHEKLAEQKQNKLEIQMLTGQNIETLKSEFSRLWPEAWEDKVFGYLQQRQKFVTNRKEHCQSIRWEFINMELHCLFDAWNEQIIELKNNHNGFSGIGLNELTLSMVDRNKKVKQREVQEVVQLSKFKLMKVLNYEDDIIESINKQVLDGVSDMNESKVSSKSLQDRLQESWEKYSWVYTPNKDVDDELDTEEESKWVYYADEALSYGLELVYLIEEELFSEIAKDLRKMTLKGQFV